MLIPFGLRSFPSCVRVRGERRRGGPICLMRTCRLNRAEALNAYCTRAHSSPTPPNMDSIRFRTSFQLTTGPHPSTSSRTGRSEKPGIESNRTWRERGFVLRICRGGELQPASVAGQLGLGDSVAPAPSWPQAPGRGGARARGLPAPGALPRGGGRLGRPGGPAARVSGPAATGCPRCSRTPSPRPARPTADRVTRLGVPVSATCS